MQGLVFGLDKLTFRRKYRTFILLAFLGTTSAFTYSFLPDYLANKMSRQLSKTFGKKTEFVEQKLTDTLNINHSLFKISQSDTIAGYAIISRALGCQIGGCETPTVSQQSFEQFYFVTVFDKKKNIKCVRVLEYTSDHGYQIANKGWLKQFEKGSHFKVGTNVDGISGATISVNSITEGVNKQLQIMNTLKK
jgi:hypothetical protein